MIAIWFAATEMIVVDGDGDGVGGGGSGDGVDGVGDAVCLNVCIEPKDDCFDDNENDRKSL